LARRQAQQNEWELVQTNRTKVILSLALLSMVAQGACDARGSQGADRASGDRRGGGCRFTDVRHQLLSNRSKRYPRPDGAAHIPVLHEMRQATD
jgi:hypothetical protein